MVTRMVGLTHKHSLCVCANTKQPTKDNDKSGLASLSTCSLSYIIESLCHNGHYVSIGTQWTNWANWPQATSRQEKEEAPCLCAVCTSSMWAFGI